MDKYKFHSILICVSLFITSFSLPLNINHTQGQNFVETSLEAFHDESPIEFHGLISSQTLNIPIPKNWLIGEENWMEIQLVASPLLDLSRSSITLSLNDLQVSSLTIAGIPEKEQRILIPSEMFKQGNNILTFTSALYLPGDRDTNCQNWDDPSRWLSIKPNGIFHLSFIRRDLTVDLSDFRNVFINPLENNLPEQKNTLIVMPEDRTDDDLTSLSTLSYALGKNADATYQWHPEIITENQLDSGVLAGRNVIFIGKTPQQLQDIANVNKDYIALLSSPWSPGFAVMVIGDRSRRDGYAPSLLLSDPTRSMLLHGNVAYMDQQPLPVPLPFPNNYSFEDLGYLDRTVRGIGHQNLVYSLYVPYDVDPVQMKLNLMLIHSPDLDLQSSSFTIFLNGFSVAGILPPAQNSTEPITIGLPAIRFRPGINFIRISFDLHIPDSSCERAPESVWATILRNSNLDMISRNRSPIPSLSHFPLPFSDYPGFTYVIPDQYDLTDISKISQLSFIMGSSSPQLNYPPSVITESNFLLQKEGHRNVILFGLPMDNSAIREINDLLPQPFNKNNNSLKEGFGVYLPSPDRDASLGLIEIIPSPWANDGTILAVTGDDQQGLEWAFDLILNFKSWNQFTGNLVVVGSGGKSESFEEAPLVLFQQTADASNIPIIGPLLQKVGLSFLVPSLIAIGTALILVLLILWIVKSIRSRNAPAAVEELDRQE